MSTFPFPNSPEALPVASADRSLLDRVHRQLSDPGGDVDRALRDLYTHLSRWRERADQDAWKQAIEQQIRPHPLCELLHREPFTRRGFDKPRGYAGDAVLIDYVYGIPPHGAMDPAMDRIHRHVTSTPGARSVCQRRASAAAWIDAVPVRGSVLAVAAGHLREAPLSRRMAAGRLARFLALDQDDSSLAMIRADYGHLGVQAVHGSVRQIINGEFTAQGMDLVYSTGLYDYLGQQTAQRLTAALWEMVAPGGRLVVANFLPSTSDLAYIEAYMDWWLTCRTEVQMRDLFAALPQETIGNLVVEADSRTDIVYATAQRAA